MLWKEDRPYMVLRQKRAERDRHIMGLPRLISYHCFI